MRVILYTKTLRKVSGLQTWEKNFCKAMHKYFDITFIYQDGDNKEFLQEIGKYVKFIQDTGSVQEADVCIYSSLQHGILNNIQASKYVQVLHTDLKAWNFELKRDPRVSLYVAVGEGVAQSLKLNEGLEAVVIPNMLSEPVVKPVLHLMTASRLAMGKGFDRTIKLARMFQQANKEFVWEIYGSGAPSYIENLKYALNGIPEVVLMGARTNIQSYMAVADYVVQLSDNEGFCYSMFEALQVGTPVIVTDWEGVRTTVRDGVNGYVLDMGLENVDIERMFHKVPENVTLKEVKVDNLWLQLLDN